MVSRLLSIFQSLAKSPCVSCQIGGETYCFEHKQGRGFVITATVYYADGYFPPSVKEAVCEASAKRELPKGYQLQLLADDNLVNLTLNQASLAQDFSIFRDSLNEFIHMADDWRERLSGLDRRDLVHVDRC